MISTSSAKGTIRRKILPRFDLCLPYDFERHSRGLANCAEKALQVLLKQRKEANAKCTTQLSLRCMFFHEKISVQALYSYD
jgi:hypothetical protein